MALREGLNISEDKILTNKLVGLQGVSSLL